MNFQILTKYLLVFFILILSASIYSQNNFRIENGKGKFTAKFDLVNDLVIIPISVNGQPLSFLLDTGVDSTILFDHAEGDTIDLNSQSVIYLKGLGDGKPLRAILSRGNEVQFGDAISDKHNIYVIQGGVFNLSNRMGVAINGILGYDFFKNFIVEFNYRREKVSVFDPQYYEYGKCGKCIDLPLSFYKKKPYIDAEVVLDDNQKKKVKLLLDSGSGDAIWLFQNQEKGIELPEASFSDFLGFGISGSVYGDRTRIKELHIGKFQLMDVTASFPDSTSLAYMDNFEARNGTLGAQVIKRFHSVIDYRGRNIRLKPNGDFREPFEYDMSGVVVKHSGFKIVKNKDLNSQRYSDEEGPERGVMVYKTSVQVFYSMEPNYEIAEIRPDSPAEFAGLKIGDELLKLNGKVVHKYSLENINRVLSSGEGKRIRMEVLREGKPVKLSFVLKRIL
ncbi:aspartyl protease family protein [Christiangramia aquimixticola]|uniref:aspartyl protease family protein n=1 Tax=Christiangramia aquimixticola TaxID=1697558 RepID=UPI003AA86D88